MDALSPGSGEGKVCAASWAREVVVSAEVLFGLAWFISRKQKTEHLDREEA